MEILEKRVILSHKAGADASKLALPPNTNPAIYQEFEVIKRDIRNYTSRDCTVGWFGRRWFTI